MYMLLTKQQLRSYPWACGGWIICWQGRRNFGTLTLQAFVVPYGLSLKLYQFGGSLNGLVSASKDGLSYSPMMRSNFFASPAFTIFPHFGRVGRIFRHQLFLRRTHMFSFLKCEAIWWEMYGWWYTIPKAIAIHHHTTYARGKGRVWYYYVSRRGSTSSHGEGGGIASERATILTAVCTKCTYGWVGWVL